MRDEGKEVRKRRKREKGIAKETGEVSEKSTGKEREGARREEARPVSHLHLLIPPWKLLIVPI